MFEWALRKLNSHYIVVMMLITRVVGSFGGFFVLYYVNLTTAMSAEMRAHFYALGSVQIVVAVSMTVPLALLGSVHLRRALRRLRRQLPLDAELARLAGVQSVLFAKREHLREAVLVPCLSVVPMCWYLWWRFDAPTHLLIQVVIAGFLAVASVLLTTFFFCERWMMPVTRHLLDSGVSIDFDALQSRGIRARMNVTFILIILVTSLLIGALANQRAQDIADQPALSLEAVYSLRQHIVYITLAAVTVGTLFSRMLSSSIASRVANLVAAMQRVQNGNLTERLQPTGNDEIDVLARKFNAMVEQLAANNQMIRDLNANLERKVRLRTRQLSKSKAKLQRSLTKLREYDRIKTEFFANISHELRTPLTMILSPVERIVEKYHHALDQDVLNKLEVVLKHGHRLLELINRLLDFSKLEAGQVRLRVGKVNLENLISGLARSATPLVEQRAITLTTEIAAELPEFGADQEKLDTVLSNLLSNAIKFTPEQGQIRISASLAGDRARVVVSDTGIGIPPEDYERVFERFVQLDGSSSREFAGTGLGLALAKDLIELHEGTIGVWSTPGAGSNFWFEIPLRPAPIELEAPGPEKKKFVRRFAELDAASNRSAGQQAPAQQHLALDASAPCVLVVDDTPEIRDLVGEILGEEFRLLYAEDGRQGFELARQHLPDLIVSDMMMPHVDGQTFCRMVKEAAQTAAIPFVMLTAKAEMSMKLEGLGCGADDYLVKPFDRRELLARVRSLLKLRSLHHQLDKRNRELDSTLQELRATQSQLIQSEKMSSLGQLVAGLAHEINNSINAVYNGIKPLCTRTRKLESLVAEALEKNDPPREEISTDIQTAFQKIFMLAEVIEHGATRTTRIVSDLRTFSHPGSEEPEPFELHTAIDVCLNLLLNQMKHRVEVHKDYGEIGIIHGPSGPLNQVFMNILQNAQQAIEGSGDVWITSRLDAADNVVLTIRDNGKGIASENMSRIFDPFFTTKPPGVGTGLGLSLSYAIISRMGGAITCQSVLGEGTQFSLTFPRVTRRAGEQMPLNRTVSPGAHAASLAVGAVS